MAIKITKPIVKYGVSDTKSQSDSAPAAVQETTTLLGTETDASDGESNVIRMHERIVRPEMLTGSTYKITTPVSAHALYVTINDMTLNEGTPYERQRPFEIFLNSKNLENFQWTVALTRIISAIFRKGGDNTFLVEELQAVFDPRGGYFKPGGRFMPSLVAEIGSVIETHMIKLGMIESAANKVSPEAQKILDEKRKEFEGQQALNLQSPSDTGFPANSKLCTVCHTVAVVYSDGCMVCLNCGDSKCS